MTTISRTSTEDLFVPVSVHGRSLSGAVVSVAILADEDDVPTSGDWHLASLEASTTTEGEVNILVGPNAAVNPGPGRWWTWTRVQLGDVDVQRPTGQLIIQ